MKRRSDIGRYTDRQCVAASGWLFVLVLICLLTAGCSPRIYPVQRDTVNIVRTEIREVLKDTTIYVTLPQDSIVVATPDTASELRIRAAISEASVKGGVLHHSLYSDPTYKHDVVIRYKDRVEYRDSIIRVANTEVLEIEKPLTWWQRLMQGMGHLMLVFLIAALLFGIHKLMR